MPTNSLVIPLELRNKATWVCHRSKQPMDPNTGLAGSSTNPATWATYAEAVEAAEKYGFDGVGFVFDPANGFVGIDFDHVIKDGVIAEYVQEIMRKCDSYAEISPSGEGVHIIVKGTIPKSFKTDRVEVYDRGRYFTVTGNIIRPYATIREVDLGFLFEGQEKEKVARVNTEAEAWTVSELEQITPGIGYRGRTPTFVRVIGRLKSKGLAINEVVAFLLPWAEKHNYGTERLEKLVHDQFQRYPVLETAGTMEEKSPSLGSFLSDYQPVNWIIPGMLAENTINLIVGLPECRKSFVLLDLAVALAAGAPWLGRFECQKKRVMVIDQERPKVEMQRRLKALIAGRGMSPNALEGTLLPVVGTTIRLDNVRSYESLCRRIENDRPEVLLVDSFKAFQSKEITNNTDMQAVMESVKQLRMRYGLTIVFLFHENKGAYMRDREGQAVTNETVAGAAVLSEVPEGIFVVQKHDAASSLIHHTKSSYGPKIAPVMVRVVDKAADKSVITVEAF